MNKYQEALRIMCNGCDEASKGGCDGFNQNCHSYAPLKELVEKATPKKPTNGLHYLHCQTCKNHLPNAFVEYCPHCGQRLDFGDEDED